MTHPDIGHKQGSYSNFTHAFLTNVVSDSSMAFSRWPIGQVIPALGWGTLVCVESLNDSNPPPMCRCGGTSCELDTPILLESEHDVRR